MKKRYTLLATAALLISHMGMEINNAKKHYVLKNNHFDSNNFTYQMMSQPTEIQQKKQLSYQFAVSRKDTGQDVAIITMLMGQEKESFYGGHIHYQEAIALTKENRKEIYERIFEIYREKLMGHIYFVCGAKEKDEISFVESLGATFTKDVSIPETDPNYLKGMKPKKQYKLVLIEDKKKDKK